MKICMAINEPTQGSSPLGILVTCSVFVWLYTCLITSPALPNRLDSKYYESYTMFLLWDCQAGQVSARLIAIRLSCEFS